MCGVDAVALGDHFFFLLKFCVLEPFLCLVASALEKSTVILEGSPFFKIKIRIAKSEIKK